MTNREYLNTLSNEDFAREVLAKQSELHMENFDPELDIFDITLGEEFDFIEWLNEEHEEN
ncbi:MAG: hypothetical protein HFE33_05300 [Clostridia bacterium]|nr:hypothetical protein [Clostridia bacterium]